MFDSVPYMGIMFRLRCRVDKVGEEMKVWDHESIC